MVRARVARPSLRMMIDPPSSTRTARNLSFSIALTASRGFTPAMWGIG
jgi:hypothetical protein